jgi:hypothetical protein
MDEVYMGALVDEKVPSFVVRSAIRANTRSVERAITGTMGIVTSSARIGGQPVRTCLLALGLGRHSIE